MVTLTWRSDDFAIVLPAPAHIVIDGLWRPTAASPPRALHQSVNRSDGFRTPRRIQPASIVRVTIPRMRRLALLSFVVATAGALSAQAPAALDWTAARRRDAEALPGPRADRLHRSAHHAAGGGEAGRRLPARGARERGHRHRDLRARPEPAQPRGPHQGVGQEAPPAAHGAHRHGEHRPEEVDPSPLQRPAPGRLHLRPRHGRRQGQRHRHAHGPAHC